MDMKTHLQLQPLMHLSWSRSQVPRKNRNYKVFSFFFDETETETSSCLDKIALGHHLLITAETHLKGNEPVEKDKVVLRRETNEKTTCPAMSPV